jgi:hypothetical protein
VLGNDYKWHFFGKDIKEQSLSSDSPIPAQLHKAEIDLGCISGDLSNESNQTHPFIACSSSMTPHIYSEDSRTIS